MRKFTFFTSFLFCVLIIPHTVYTQTPDWTSVLLTYTDGLPSLNLVTADANNIYMAGKISGPITFNGINYACTGYNDLLVAKMSNSGAVLWVSQITAQVLGSIIPDAINVDGNGNIYIAATFSGTVTIGSSTVTSSLINNAFYAKFDGSGNGVWATPFSSYTYAGNSSKIAFDGSGNSFLMSKTNQLLKWNSAGAIQWTQTYPVRTLQTIAVYGSDLYLGGALQNGTTNFGTIPLTSLGGYNTGFLVKGDLTGVYNNSLVVGGSTTGYGSSVSDIVMDNSGNLIISGAYTKDLIVGGITITNPTKSFYTYIAKCDNNFNFVWAKSSSNFINLQREMFTYRLFFDNYGNLYEYGKINSSFSFGAVSLTLAEGNQFLIKFDASGNALNGYALENSSNDRTFVNQSGKVLIGSVYDCSGSPFFGNFYISQYDNTLIQEWQHVSSNSLSGIAEINAIKYDAGGNTYLQSRIIGHCNYFGTIINTTNYLTVISKHDISGNLLWIDQIPDINPDLMGPIFTLDKDNNVLFVGLFHSSLTIGTTTLTSSNAGNEGYVAKYSPTGVFLWASKLNLNADVSINITLASDKAGNVIVSGVVAPANYLVKFDSSGNQLWAKTFPMESYYESMVSADENNNIYLTSEIYPIGTITIGTIPLTQTNEDGATVLVKFDPNGNTLWAKLYGGVTGASYPDGWPCDIKTDSTGNTFLWGWCQDNAIFGSYTLVNPFSTNAGWSYFLTKINTSGDVIWANAVYENMYSYNYGDLLDLDKKGNVYVGGHFRDKISIDGNEFVPEGLNDFFIAKFSDAGTYQWIGTVPANTNIMNALSVYDENILSVVGETGKNETLGTFYIYKTSGSNCMVATMANMNPEPDPITINGAAGSSTIFNIFTIQNWTAVSDQTWLTVTPGSGSGSASITLTAEANFNAEPRTAIVTITYTGIKASTQTLTINQSGSSSIAEIKQNDYAIYPNPATNVLFFNSNIKNAFVSILDLNGKVIFGNHVNDGKIDISNLKKGVYTIKIVDETGVIVRKFVKQ